MTYNESLTYLANNPTSVLKRRSKAYKIYKSGDSILATCAVTNGIWNFIATNDDKNASDWYILKV